MLNFLGSLLGGGLNFLGGMFGQQNQAQINQQNIQAQEAINAQNIANANATNNYNWTQAFNMAGLNTSNAEAFAKQGVQWRVQDAKDAGINPLAALGSSFAPSAPVGVGATSVAPNLQAPVAQASNSFGTGVAAMGQDISRAIQATRSPEDQAVAMEKTRQDLEAGQLDNELKRAQLSSSIMRLRSAQVGPGIPRSKSVSHPEMQVVTLPDGSKTTMASRDVEGVPWMDETAKAAWSWRNTVEPTFGYNIPREMGKPGAGKSWYRNPFTGRFYQMYPLTGNDRGNHSGIDPYSVYRNLFGQ